MTALLLATLLLAGKPEIALATDGSPSMFVLVEELPPSAVKGGMDKGALQRVTTSRLKRCGVPVVTTSSTLLTYSVNVNVIPTKNGFAANVGSQCYTFVEIKGVSSKVLIWESSLLMVGPMNGLGTQALEALVGQIDEFCAEYQKAKQESAPVKATAPKK